MKHLKRFNESTLSQEELMNKHAREKVDILEVEYEREDFDTDFYIVGHFSLSNPGPHYKIEVRQTYTEDTEIYDLIKNYDMAQSNITYAVLMDKIRNTNQAIIDRINLKYEENLHIVNLTTYNTELHGVNSKVASFDIVDRDNTFYIK